MHLLPVLAISATVAQANLFPRQGGLPPECQPTCNPVSTFVLGNGNCTDTPQCCTVQFEQGVASCYECLGKSINTMDFGVAQQNLDKLVQACVQLGFTMMKITLPGQDPDLPLTTAPATSTRSQTPPPQTSSSISLRPPPSLSTGTTSLVPPPITTSTIPGTTTTLRPPPSLSTVESTSLVPPPITPSTIPAATTTLRPPPSLSTGESTSLVPPPITPSTTTTTPSSSSSSPTSSGSPAGNSARAVGNIGGGSAFVNALVPVMIIVTCIFV